MRPRLLDLFCGAGGAAMPQGRADMRPRHMRGDGDRPNGGPVVDEDPVPVVPAQVSPFAGRGCFTAHDPLCLIREGIADCFDWVALKGDGGDAATITDAWSLRKAGVPRVHVWYSWDGLPTLDLLAAGWIGQAEGPEQLARSLMLAPVSRPRALVTNVFMDSWPAGWYCLGEAYTNVNPNATPAAIEYEARKRGAVEFSPVFGMYDGSSEREEGSKIPLEEYLTQLWHGDSWVIYTAEYLDASDIEFLKKWPR